jgi:hypothetical protein
MAMSWSMALRRSPNLVDHQGGQGLTLEVLGDHRQRLPGLHDLLQDWQEVLHRGDLLVRQQDVRLLEHALHPLGVGDEVGRDVALVEAHPLDQLELHAEGLGFLHRDDAVLAHPVHGLGDLLADLGVAGGDRGHVGDLVLGLDLLGLVLDGLNGRLDPALDAPLEGHRVGPGRDVPEPLLHHGLGQHGGRGGAVAGDVVGLLGDLLHQLRPHLLQGLLELDLLGDGDAVVGDGGGAPLLLQDHVSALGAEGDPDRVGQLVHAPLQGPPGLLLEIDDLRRHPSSLRSQTILPAASTLTPRLLTNCIARRTG